MTSPSSLYSLESTWVYSKLMCWKPAYIVHLVFAYLTVAVGLLAILCRLDKRLNRVHIWLGRLYVIFMVWSMGSSLLIFNTGLPLFVVYSFVWVLGGLSLGWVAIGIHQERRRRSSQQLSSNNNEKSGNPQLTVDSMDATVDYEISNAVAGQRVPESRWQALKSKMFSWKALHGISMTVSWASLAGRAFGTSPPADGFECFSYPAYKPIALGTEHNFTPSNDTLLVPLPDINSRYSQTIFFGYELEFGLLWLVAPAVLAVITGTIYVLVEHKRGMRRQYQLLSN